MKVFLRILIPILGIFILTACTPNAVSVLPTQSQPTLPQLPSTVQSTLSPLPSISPTFNVIHSLTPTQTVIYVPSPTVNPCGIGWSRIEIGPYTSVATDNLLANNAREAPGLFAKIIGGLPPGSLIKILDGPVCADGYIWWKVESPLISAKTVWTAEGDGKAYYLTTNHLLLSTETTLTSAVIVENGRYVFRVTADRVLPEPKQLRGGGRIDIIWFVDADNNQETGQSHLGNDYNIHLSLDEFGWRADIIPVSPVALEKILQDSYSEIKFKVNGLKAEISFPTSFLPQDSFSWWLDASSLNASDNWRSLLPFTASLPKIGFPNQ